MTSNEFRRLALSFPETSEKSHMDHPDFRVAASRKCSSKLNQAFSIHVPARGDAEAAPTCA